MTYEIRAAYRPGKAITTAQRSSGLFDFAPRIGTTTLRQGMVLRLNDAEYEHHKDWINRLLAAETILVNKEGEKVPDSPAAERPAPMPTGAYPSAGAPTSTTASQAAAAMKTNVENMTSNRESGAGPGADLPSPDAEPRKHIRKESAQAERDMGVGQAEAQVAGQTEAAGDDLDSRKRSDVDETGPARRAKKKP